MKMKFNKEIWIGEKKISDDTGTFIIAEAGVNHNGSMSVAKEMIDVAVESGADAVKFQTFKAEKLILKDVEKAPYQRLTTETGETQYEMLKRLEMTQEQAKELKCYCQDKKIIFLSTAFEKDSLDELDRLNIPAFKIAATDLTNVQFLKQAAAKGKPMILSAGMCYLEEVESALAAIYPINQNVILLQCTANYPIKDSEANIGVINTFRDKFDMLVGYSDHSRGVGASPYAVALGAKVIEKHFTLDKAMKGPDHRASVTPRELKELVDAIRTAEKYVGDGIKKPSCSEQMTRKSLQKCFVAAEDIKIGERFTEKNIVAKRTNGVGISALYYTDLLGEKARADFRKNEIIYIE